MIPEVPLAAELCSQLLVDRVGKLKELMHEEGEEIEKEEVEGEMLLAVAVVMLDVVPLVLQGIKGFIFNLPPAPPDVYQILYVPFMNAHIRDPAAVVGRLLLLL